MPKNAWGSKKLPKKDKRCLSFKQSKKLKLTQNFKLKVPPPAKKKEF